MSLPAARYKGMAPGCRRVHRKHLACFWAGAGFKNKVIFLLKFNIYSPVTSRRENIVEFIMALPSPWGPA
jgi:hypothetical protein